MVDHLIGQRSRDTLRVDLDYSAKPQSHDSTISSKGGLGVCHQDEQGFVLTAMADKMLMDLGAKSSIQQHLKPLAEKWQDAIAEERSPSTMVMEVRGRPLGKGHLTNSV